MNQNGAKIFLTCLTLTVAACFCLSILGIGAGGFLLWTEGKHAQDAAPPQSTPLPPAGNGTTPETATVTPFGDSSTPEASGEIPPEIARQMDEIEQQVQELRGLQAAEPLQRRLLSTEALRRRVLDDFLSDYSPEEAHDDALALSAFGLLEPDYDLIGLYEDLYTEQVAGFYDDETDTMYVVQDADFSGVQRMTYAHEYTHALQDQNFGLREALGMDEEHCKADSEHCAAMQAVVEGDATLSEETWLYTYATPQDFEDIFAFYGEYQSPVYDSAPEFLKEDFLFPYQQGKDFVQHLYDQGDWAAVDAAFTTQPQSTEQILHPERYPDDAPIAVTLPDLASVFSVGWREVDSGTLGEWYTYLMLAQGAAGSARLPEDVAAEAAAGWGGDAYAVFFSPDESQFALVLDMRWDDPSEANEFRRALLRHASRRFGVATETPAESLWAWRADALYSALHQEAARTVWLIAPDEATAEAMWGLLTAP